LADSQNLVVEVPDCERHGHRLKCKEPPTGHGTGSEESGSQASGGRHPGGRDPFEILAETGLNPLVALGTASILLISGAAVVLTERRSRRAPRVAGP
jgi:hypothetical protein